MRKPQLTINFKNGQNLIITVDDPAHIEFQSAYKKWLKDSDSANRAYELDHFETSASTEPATSVFDFDQVRSCTWVVRP